MQPRHFNYSWGGGAHCASSALRDITLHYLPKSFFDVKPSTYSTRSGSKQSSQQQQQLPFTEEIVFAIGAGMGFTTLPLGPRNSYFFNGRVLDFAGSFVKHFPYLPSKVHSGESEEDLIRHLAQVVHTEKRPAVLLCDTYHLPHFDRYRSSHFPAHVVVCVDIDPEEGYALLAERSRTTKPFRVPLEDLVQAMDPPDYPLGTNKAWMEFNYPSPSFLEEMKKKEGVATDCCVVAAALKKGLLASARSLQTNEIKFDGMGAPPSEEPPMMIPSGPVALETMIKSLKISKQDFIQSFKAEKDLRMKVGQEGSEAARDDAALAQEKLKKIIKIRVSLVKRIFAACKVFENGGSGGANFRILARNAVSTLMTLHSPRSSDPQQEAPSAQKDSLLLLQTAVNYLHEVEGHYESMELASRELHWGLVDSLGENRAHEEATTPIGRESMIGGWARNWDTMIKAAEEIKRCELGYSGAMLQYFEVPRRPPEPRSKL